MPMTFPGIPYLGSFTWANRPTSAPVGAVMRASDVGSASGTHWVWDGTYWRPLGGRAVVARLAANGTRTSVNGAGDATLSDVASVTFPASLLLIPKSRILITAFGTRTPATANINQTRVSLVANAYSVGLVSGSLWGTNAAGEMNSRTFVTSVSGTTPTTVQLGTPATGAPGAGSNTSTTADAGSGSATASIGMAWSAAVAVAETVTIHDLVVELSA
jgi:uncharacterized membrane protein